jgi:hypothetical protein
MFTSFFRRFWPRKEIICHDPCLAASPLVRYILKWRGVGTLLSPGCPLWMDMLRAKRSCAAYGGTVGP